MTIITNKVSKLLNEINSFRHKFGLNSILALENNAFSLMRKSNSSLIKLLVNLPCTQASTQLLKKNFDVNKPSRLTNASLMRFENNPEKFIKYELSQVQFTMEQYRKLRSVFHQYGSHRHSYYHLQKNLAEWYARSNSYGNFLAQDRELRQYVISFFNSYHQFRITVGDVFIARSHGRLFLSGFYFKSSFDEWQNYFSSRTARVFTKHALLSTAIKARSGENYLQQKSNTLVWYNMLQWMRSQYPKIWGRNVGTSVNLTNNMSSDSSLPSWWFKKSQLKKLAVLRRECSLLNRMVEFEHNFVANKKYFSQAGRLPLGWQSLQLINKWKRPVLNLSEKTKRKNQDSKHKLLQRRLVWKSKFPVFKISTSKAFFFKKSFKTFKNVISARRFLKVPVSSLGCQILKTLNLTVDNYKFSKKLTFNAKIRVVQGYSMLGLGKDKNISELKKNVHDVFKTKIMSDPLVNFGFYCQPVSSNVKTFQNLLKKYWLQNSFQFKAINTSRLLPLPSRHNYFLLKLEKAFDQKRFNLVSIRLGSLVRAMSELSILVNFKIGNNKDYSEIYKNSLSQLKQVKYANIFAQLQKYGVASQARISASIRNEITPGMQLEQLYRQLEHISGCQVFINLTSLVGGLSPRKAAVDPINPLYKIFQQQFKRFKDKPWVTVWMEAAPAILLAPQKDAALLLKLIVRAFKLTNYRQYNRFFGLIKRYMSAAIACLGSKSGLQGFKLLIRGKLKRNPRSVEERILVGRMPLRTFDARVIYAFHSVRRKRGVFGFKLWLYFGRRQSAIVKKRKKFIWSRQMSQLPAQDRLNAISWEYANQVLKPTFWNSFK